MFCWSSLAINSLKQHLSYLGFRRSLTSGRASEALIMSKASKPQCCWLMPSALFFLGVWQEAGRFRRFTKTRRCSKKKNKPTSTCMIRSCPPDMAVAQNHAALKALGNWTWKILLWSKQLNTRKLLCNRGKTTCTKTRSRNGTDTKFHPGCRFFDNLASRV